MTPAPPPPRDPDADPRIRGLLDRSPATNPDFLTRVRNKIHRRVAVTQVADMSWNLPKTAAVEMVSILRHLFTAFSSNKGP